VPSSSARALGWRLPAALFAVYVVWGSTYLAMRFAIDGVPPMLMVGIRHTIAGLLLFGFLVVRRHRLPTAAQWLRAVPVGVLFFVGGNGFVALAEQRIGSGLASVIVATMPLWMALVGTVVGDRPTRRELVGVVIGVAGAAVLMGESELRAAPAETLLLFLAPLSWACGSVMARRVDLPEGAMAPAAEMLAGGVVAGGVGLLVGERISAAPPAGALWAIGYLVVFGSLIGFMAFTWLLGHTRPALATSHAFVNPVIAVMLGAALGAERFGWQTAAAVPLVVAAVALVVTARQR
jgi:drug/metabolite transporter (DMT)-like permease